MPSTAAAKLLNTGDAGSAPRKSDLAYHFVKRRIILGEYSAMMALAEHKLAAELDCSQGTVREALLRLEHEGLVSRRGYQGTVVSATSLPEAAQMIRIRLVIEREAARDLAGNMYPKDRQEILAITDLMKAAHEADDYYTRSELDRSFHGSLLRAAGMDALVPILLRCSHYIHRFTLSRANRSVQHRGRADTSEVHRELLASIAEGTPDTAEQAVIEHIENVIRRGAPRLLHAVADGGAALLSNREIGE